MDYLAQILGDSSEERLREETPSQGKGQNLVGDLVDGSGVGVVPSRSSLKTPPSRLFSSQAKQVRSFGRRRKQRSSQ